MNKKFVCFFLLLFFGLANGQTVFAQPEPKINYDKKTNTIKVTGPGATVDLTAINNVLLEPKVLEKVGPSEWLLKANLSIDEGVSLNLHGQAAGGDVDWLKLRSEPNDYVSLEAFNGNISIKNTKITSWDAQKKSFDAEFLDGSKRAFVAVKNSDFHYSNRMDVIDSEVAFLGFFEETAYGISWKTLQNPANETGVSDQGITGVIRDSRFHDNYFGVYVWGAKNLEVRNNEFYDNYVYGFDAHTFTQSALLENNFSHNNGSHGIIFADRTTKNILKNNRSVDNEGHGIMLHEFSNDNSIIDNEIAGNDDGVAIFESSNNAISGNKIKNNVTGVRVYGRANYSKGNLFENNEIFQNRIFGIYVYDSAKENTFRKNRLFSNGDSNIKIKNAPDNAFGDNILDGQTGFTKNQALPLLLLIPVIIVVVIFYLRKNKGSPA